MLVKITGGRWRGVGGRLSASTVSAWTVRKIGGGHGGVCAAAVVGPVVRRPAQQPEDRRSAIPTYRGACVPTACRYRMSRPFGGAEVGVGFRPGPGLDHAGAHPPLHRTADVPTADPATPDRVSAIGIADRATLAAPTLLVLLTVQRPRGHPPASVRRPHHRPSERRRRGRVGWWRETPAR
jgi:hypothetical protein